MGPLELFIILGWIACIGGCAMLAVNRNRNPALWAVLGFFFGLIALLIVAVSSTVEQSVAPPSLPVEGWYRNPDVEDELRWWDGARWTGATKRAGDESAAHVPAD